VLVDVEEAGGNALSGGFAWLAPLISISSAISERIPKRPGVIAGSIEEVENAAQFSTLGDEA